MHKRNRYRVFYIITHSWRKATPNYKQAIFVSSEKRRNLIFNFIFRSHSTSTISTCTCTFVLNILFAKIVCLPRANMSIQAKIIGAAISWSLKRCKDIMFVTTVCAMLFVINFYTLHFRKQIISEVENKLMCKKLKVTYIDIVFLLEAA